MDASPIVVTTAIETDLVELDEVSKKLSKAIQKLALNKGLYERVSGKLLRDFYEHETESGRRMPAKDVRDALLLEEIQKSNGDLHAELLSDEGDVDAYKARLRALEAALSARQSLLSALRFEASIS